jgi:Anti-sigma-K factor rskA
MLNREDSHPAYFEELCALAASGQISEPELLELRDHLQQCAECRTAYSDFVDLVHNKLPLLDPEATGVSKRPDFFSEDSSYRRRFLARARKEGILVSRETVNTSAARKFKNWVWPEVNYSQVATMGGAVLFIIIALMGYGWHQANVRYQRLVAENIAVKAQSSARSAPDQPHRSAQAAPPAPLSDSSAPNRAALPPNQAELENIRAEGAAAEARSKALEDQLSQMASTMEILRSEGEKTSGSRDQLEKKLKEAEQVANAVKDDLEEIRQARFKDNAIIAAQDVEIRKLSDKLHDQEEILQQETALLQASSDVRDLMGARNFHVADVYDVDSKGKDQQAFGRVFYTEGKSTLIFYAFDLSDKNATKRNASFQVWGTRGPAQGPTHSLGLFQIDDKKQNRWVLRFEDPRVLSEIDSVFVTVEPTGGSNRPTGRKLLFAYLNANTNR